MNLKKKLFALPLWIKAGIMSVFIHFFYYLIFAVLIDPTTLPEFLFFPFLPLFFLLAIVGSLLDSIFNIGWGYESVGKFPVLMILIALLYTFLVGALIGFIIQLIKKRKNTKNK